MQERKKGEGKEKGSSQATSVDSSTMRSTVSKTSLLSTKNLRNPSMLGCQVSPPPPGSSSPFPSAFSSPPVGVLRSLMATNLISSTMPLLSPGWSLRYLTLFFVTGGPDREGGAAAFIGGENEREEEGEQELEKEKEKRGLFGLKERWGFGDGGRVVEGKKGDSNGLEGEGAAAPKHDIFFPLCIAGDGKGFIPFFNE